MSKEITKELKNIFTYIKDDLSSEFPKSILTPEYFILAVLTNRDCTAYRILSRVMLGDSINVMVSWYQKYLSDNSSPLVEGKVTLDKTFDDFIKDAEKLSDETMSNNISSAHLLCAVFKKKNVISDSFKIVNVGYQQIHRYLINYYYSLRPHKPSNKPKNDKENHQIQKKNNETIKQKKFNTTDNNVERNTINLNTLHNEGKLDPFYEGDDLYKRVFQVFSKRKCNNVAIIGKSGVGKSSFARNLASFIEEGKAPENFEDKKVVELEMDKLFMNTGIRGVFESKMANIIDDATKSGEYIFFIDNLSSIFNVANKSESDVAGIFKKIMENKNINFICTSTREVFDEMCEDYYFLKNDIQPIILDEPDKEQSFEILTKLKDKLETFHNIKYDDDVIKTCISLSKDYLTDTPLPLSAINVMDETGAKVNIETMNNGIFDRLNDERAELIYQFVNYKNHNQNDTDYYDKLDEFVKKRIELENRISEEMKKDRLDKQPLIIKDEDIREVVSTLSGLPLEKLNDNEKARLRVLEDNLKEDIIGQDEAIKIISKTVRRKRIGIRSKGKPIVFLFVGSTGTGKTYMAKKIAEKVFGDEKYMVRLDMSEYNDETSTNKLIGSSSGYVGYNDGGVLTNAIKEKKYCVLLLDEIEKAHTKVFNMFLQLFDEGRISDNKGNEVDCRNLIVVMTSNIGARESLEHGKPIGFNCGDIEDNKRRIINKALKNKFSPEFLNRIDNIINFNTLTEDNLKAIIKLELNKLRANIEEIGHSTDDSFISDKMVNLIFNNVKDKREFGARPILRSIEENIEDKITDLVLEGDEPHIFTENDF